MRAQVQRIIQLYGCEGREEEWDNQSMQLIEWDIKAFFEVIIDVAQDLRVQYQERQNPYTKHQPYPNNNKPKQLSSISQIINHQIINLIDLNKIQTHKQQSDIYNRIYERIFKSNMLGEYEFCAHLLPSLEAFLGICCQNKRKNILQNWGQIMQTNEDIELIVCKALFMSTKDLLILTHDGVKFIESFLSKFPITLQSLVHNELPRANSQQEAINVVTQRYTDYIIKHRARKWILYIQLLIKLFHHTSIDENFFQNILFSLSKYHFSNVIIQMMRIDQSIQIKSISYKEQLIGLELLVSCRFQSLNQYLNILKKYAIKSICVILINIYSNQKLIQIYFSDIIDALLSFKFYQHLIGDLSILSRHFLQLNSPVRSYLNYGQYSLVKKFYQLLDISLKLPILQERLFAAVQETLGWQEFFFFVCIINVGQFQYKMKEENNKLFGEQTVIENRNHEVFVTNLLKNSILQIEEWKEKITTLASQISTFLIEQSNQTLRKTLRDFGIQSDPMVQQYLQNPQHLNIWLHIIGLMAFQSKQITNLSLLRLLQKSSDQLSFFKLEMLKSFLNLYLNVSHALIISDQKIQQSNNNIMANIIDKVVRLIVHCPLQDNRLQFLLMFFSKFMMKSYESFHIIANKYGSTLIGCCFKNIQSHFILKEQLGDQHQKINNGDRMFKICIDFITKFIDCGCALVEQRLQECMWILQNNMETFVNLFSVIIKNQSQLSSADSLSILQLIKSILENLTGQQKIIQKQFMQIINCIMAFMIKNTQLNVQYFDSLKILIMFFGNIINSNIIMHVLHLLHRLYNNQNPMKLEISSSLLKLIIQVLTLLAIHEKAFLFDYQLWQDACIFVLIQCKNREKLSSILKKQEKQSLSPRKVIVKNRLRLQIQAFKLTIFLLSSHYKRASKQNKNTFISNHNFLQTLHNKISLTKQLSSFEQFLTFSDVCVICYAIEDYIRLMSFDERRGFLVTMAILISEQKLTNSSVKRQKDKNIVISLSSFNPIIITRSLMFELLSEVQLLTKKQDNPLRRQQHERYLVAIRLLIKQLQSITIVDNEKRKILKVNVQDCSEVSKVKAQDEQFII